MLKKRIIPTLLISDEKLVKTKRIFLKGNRIRDIDFDEDLDLVILLSENIPSIITLKKVK